MNAAAVNATVRMRGVEGAAKRPLLEDRTCVIAELTSLLDSRHFKASRRCSDFLDHIVRQTLDGNSSLLKERTLGVELFNRQANYDTNSDPVVRATAGEVRKKIAQHYQETSEGLVQIVLPVGTYIPRFEAPRILGKEETGSSMKAEEGLGSHLPPTSILLPTTVTMTKRGSTVLFVLFGSLLIAAAATLGYRQAAHSNEIAESKQANAALTTFWKPFLTPGLGTVAVFSEVGRRSTDETASDRPMGALYSGALASPGISGVGEVAAVHALDGVFSSYHRDLRVKRGNFFTFDDALNENVIFLGSPLANAPVRLLQNNRDFVFQVVGAEQGQPVLAIVDNQPKPGEPKQFLATPGKLPTKDDYAVIALLPGMRSGKKALILAGLTTFGTQAAAEFVSQNEPLRSLISRLKISRDGDIEPFEAVISVKVDDEVPVEERIVALHVK